MHLLCFLNSCVLLIWHSNSVVWINFCSCLLCAYWRLLLVICPNVKHNTYCNLTLQLKMLNIYFNIGKIKTRNTNTADIHGNFFFFFCHRDLMSVVTRLHINLFRKMHHVNIDTIYNVPMQKLPWGSYPFELILSFSGWQYIPKQTCDYKNCHKQMTCNNISPLKVFYSLRSEGQILLDKTVVYFIRPGVTVIHFFIALWRCTREKVQLL